MSHFQGSQEARNNRWQQRQREASRNEMNRNRLERHPQGEHSGQNVDRETGNRWEKDPAQYYANPRQPNTQDEFEHRNGSSDASNREWVSSPNERPFREERKDWQYQQATRTTPSFKGRGPQGYRRSDERITEDISEAMTQDDELDASDISIETKNGEVVLKGTVSNRHSKRRAEEIAEICSGVKDVQNQIRVKRTDAADSDSEARRDKDQEKKYEKRSGRTPN